MGKTRIAVFGATGGTGRHLVTQALVRGHQVTAVARRPEAVPAHPGLRVVRADVLDPDTLVEAVRGHDAVVSALGIGYRRHATTVYSDGTAHVLAAMAAAGVKRVTCVSTTSLGPPPFRADPLSWLVARGLLHPMLRRPYADMRLMEERVQASGLQWTLVRAARLTNRRPTGRYRLAVDAKLAGAWSISRADLARYLLDSLDDPRTHGAVVEIAY
ncbi:MAG: NAD(P)-dependent oxidoreductase [Mycobacteriales bacterium]